MPIRSLRRKKNEGADSVALVAEVDLVRRVLSNYAPNTVLSFGAPTRCPLCANFGLVLGLDNVSGGRSFNRCVGCGEEWIVSARALRAARNSNIANAPDVGRPSSDLRPSMIGDSLQLRAESDDAAPEGVLFSRQPDGDVNRKLLNPGRPTRVMPGGWAPLTSELVTPIHHHDGPMRVLLIEDDPDDIAVVRAILGPLGENTIDLRTARTRADGEKAALSAAPDLVLLDLGLPDSHGLATVTQWHFNKVAKAPVLVLSGDCNAEVFDRGHEFGVSGFLAKTELADLLSRGGEGTSQFLDRLTAAAAG